jgi:hypothetical protein
MKTDFGELIEIIDAVDTAEYLHAPKSNIILLSEVLRSLINYCELHQISHNGATVSWKEDDFNVDK